MRSAMRAFALWLILPVIGSAQTGKAAGPDTTKAAETKRAQELLAKVRASLGGEAKLKAVRGLSLSGKYRRQAAGKEVTGELRIDLLAPDRFLKSEKSNPRPLTVVTWLQAVNEGQVWIDRQVSRPSAGDDAGQEMAGTQAAKNTPIASGTSGMRGTTGGNTTVRTNSPGARPREQSVLGMPMPTPQGKDLDTPAAQMEKDIKTAGRKPGDSSKPPGVEDPEVRAILERQLRKEFICLSLVWLQTAPASFPLALAWGEVIKAEHGNVEAIDVAGPDEFAARLFVDQASSRPVMMSYREVINRGAGYVVSAPSEAGNQSSDASHADAQEIAVQLYFLDYRPVEGVLLPFQIIKAVNGVPVDEWKVEKYWINPDLKPKKFEKR